MIAEIKMFDQAKGFGFAQPEDGTEQLFVHVSNLSDRAIKAQLVEGTLIECEIGAPRKAGDKRPALNVKLAPTNPATAPDPGAAPPMTDPLPAYLPAPIAEPAVTISRSGSRIFEDVVSVEFSFAFSDPVLVIRGKVNYGPIEFKLLIEGEEVDEGVTDREGLFEYVHDVTADKERIKVEAFISNGLKPHGAYWHRKPLPAFVPAIVVQSPAAATAVAGKDATATGSSDATPTSVVDTLAKEAGKVPTGPKAEIKTSKFKDPTLVVRVHVYHGGDSVRLKRDGVWVDQTGMLIDGKRNADFVVQIPAGQNSAVLEAYVGNDKMPYRAIWDRPEAKIADTPTTKNSAIDFVSTELIGNQLMVTVKVLLGTGPVKLKANSEWIDNIGAQLDSKKQAVFVVPIKADWQICSLEAYHAGSDQPFRKVWKRPVAETEDDISADLKATLDAAAPDLKTDGGATTIPPEPKLEVKFQWKRGPNYTYQIQTRPNKTITVKSPCLIRVRKSDDSDWTSDGHKHNFDSVEGGTLELEIGLVTPQDRGVVTIQADGLAHQEYLTNDEPATPAI